MIRSLSLQVAVVGLLALAFAGVPVAISMMDRAIARAELAEVSAAQQAAELAAAALADGADLAAVAARLGTGAHVERRRADGTVEELGPRPPGAPPRGADGAGVSAGWVTASAQLPGGGEVSLRRPATGVARARAEVREELKLAALVGGGVVLLLAMFIGALASRTLGEVVAGVRDVVRGNARRLDIPGMRSDAIADLSTWLNVLAEDVEQKSAALKLEQGKLMAVLEGMTQGVVGLEGGKVELMNGAARRMLGVTAPLVGELLSDYVDAPELAALVATGTPGTIELSLPTKLRALARISTKPDGRGSVLVLEDVSAIRHLEMVRRDFIANVSHELRTPVAVIRANAETLLSGAKDDPIISGRLIDGLHRNAERLAHLIADLLDLSRLDAGQYRLELAALPLKAAAEQALTALAERGHPLEVDVPDDLLVRADRKALDQILVNLLENAVRYTPEGTPVALRASTERDRVRIEVRDEGPGIPPAHRDRVFERFYRADPGRVREAGGTGLGLSIVKHLVESMGGEVGLAPNHPTGCVFFVHLPSAAAPAVTPAAR